jgi:hypothetical protein
MMRFLIHMLCTLVFLAAGGGCRMFDHEAVVQRRSPLRPAQQSPDSVALEMMWVRFPADDPHLAEAAWQAIDETSIDPGVHRELANNGFRVGIITGGLPDAMAQALDQTGSSEEAYDLSGNSKMSFGGTPKVRGRLKQLRRNERWEIQASDIYPSMPLLVNKELEPMRGRTYPDAQAMYALRVDPQPDRTVAVELTPELHYGPPRLRFTGGDEGILRSEPLRDREVFDRMRMNVRLAPGDMLVLMNLPDSGGCALGEYFHTVESSEGRQQKLILLRLAQVPQSDTFAAE